MEVRIYRGRADEPAADRAITTELLRQTAEIGVSAVRVWQPHRQVAFGRRDSHTDGYDQARQAAEDHGYHSIERNVGGRAVAYTGRTLAFVHTLPIDNIRQGMCDRYTEASQQVIDVLSELGADVTRGEPTDAYCPGSHSVSSVSGGEPSGKLVGLAQRVQSRAALVSGCLTVAETDVSELRDVLGPVYRALDVPFDPASVGSISSAGGPDDPTVVRRALEDALVDSHNASVVRARDVIHDT